jgi:hypothetical protein
MRQRAGMLEQAIGQRRLDMIDVRNNAEVADVLKKLWIPRFSWSILNCSR